ncbi:MAG: (4Fe-4S)-binding protein [Acidimicrobiia bacterium]
MYTPRWCRWGSARANRGATLNHDFRHENILVSWDDEICIHAGSCVRGLPSVFDVSKDPWINPGAASPDDVAEAVRACPSGALQFSQEP